MSTPDAEVEAALAAIAEGPSDDTRRLVLADLLQERGDPRGEFLLLQFLIAENRASGAMRKRADDLLRAHRRVWLAPLKDVLTEVKLSRGFPVEARLSPSATAERVAQALASPLMATLERLISEPFTDALLVEVLASPRLRALEDVTFGGSDGLTAAAERAVAGRLRRVELAWEVGQHDVERVVTAPAFSGLIKVAFFAQVAPLARGRQRVARASPSTLFAVLERLATLHPRARDALGRRDDVPQSLPRRGKAVDALAVSGGLSRRRLRVEQGGRRYACAAAERLAHRAARARDRHATRHQARGAHAAQPDAR